MKKTYAAPTLEVEPFLFTDVLTTSGIPNDAKEDPFADEAGDPF